MLFLFYTLTYRIMALRVTYRKDSHMSRIALIGKNTIEYISLLIDIWNNGDCVILIDWQTPFHTALNMLKNAGAKACYIQSDLQDKNLNINDISIEIIPFAVSGILTSRLPDYIYDKFRTDYSQNEAVIIYSSGTTGKSKGIILSHFAINTNADAIIEYMHPSATDCIYIIKALSHSSTLTGELLVALKVHMRLIITATAVPPRYVFGIIKQYCVSILCLNPTLLSFLCDEAERKNYKLNSLKIIYVSGAILNDKVYEKAHRILIGICIYNVYGLSETAPRITAQTSECCRTNSVGKPINGVEIAIVNEKGILVSDGEQGIIHVNTPSLFSGYISETEKRRSLYCGWFNTGDIGYTDKYEELHIIGRIDDVINCDAHKVYPSDIEKLIIENPKITDCAVSKCVYNGFEMIGCLYVSDSDCIVDIIHRLKKSLMQYEIPKRFVKINSIPHNERGKVDRIKVAGILSESENERT